MMFRFLLLLACFSLLTCDDGDLITVDLEFSKDLELCTSAEDAFLIYDTKEDPSESLSVVIPRNADQIVPFINPSIPDLNAPPTYTINGAAVRFIYRRYDRPLMNNELCETVPPGDLVILDNAESSSGNIYITVTVEDDDGDGIPSDLEGRGERDANGNYPNAVDTDGDAIPDYQDEDDDNDNVPTTLEIDTLNEDGDDDPTTNPLDTDADGIPDYKDNDDDNDGVFTINEDNSGNFNPRDTSNLVVDTEGNNVYRYLYAAASDVNETNALRTANLYTRTVTATFLITNFNLDAVAATALDFGTLTYDILIENGGSND